MILANTWLERVSKVSIGSSYVGVVSVVSVGCMFFQIFFVYPFSMAMEGCRLFIRFNVRLGHVEK